MSYLPKTKIELAGQIRSKMRHRGFCIGNSTLALMSCSALVSGQDLLENLDPLVVTGSRFLEPLSAAPVRTELIDGDFLRQSGARNLAEAIEYNPGLRIDMTCANCGQMSIQMLGLSQEYVAILNDGLPNLSSLASVYGIEQIPAAMVDRIEIVKGGASVLYGPNAVAGVINLIPRDPVRTGGEIRTTLGDFSGNTFNQNPSASAFGVFDFVSEDESLKISTFYNFDRIQPVDINGDGFTNVAERELNAGGFRAVWSPSKDHKFSLDYFLSDESRRGGDITPNFNLPPNRSLIAEAIDTKRQVATAMWTGKITENVGGQVAYSYSRTDRDSYYGGIAAFFDPIPGAFDSRGFAQWAETDTGLDGFGTTRDHLHFIDTRVDWEASEEHRFTFGAQYSHESVEDIQPAANRVIDDSFSNFGLLAQHRWTANEKLTLEYGARLDFHSEVDDPIFSPRAAALYEFTDRFRVRSSVSTGFRAPQVFEEDLHIENVGGELNVTFQDPDLKEESSVTIAVAPEWQITDSWRFEANAFHTWLKDTLVIEPDNDPTTSIREFIRTNGEDSRVYGLELNLGYFQPDWRLEFSWVEQRQRFSNPQAILGDETFADPLDNPIFSNSFVRTPESLGLIRFTHENPWFDTIVTARFTGPMDVPHIVTAQDGELVGNRLRRTEWFANIDVGVRKQFELDSGSIFEVNAGVRNLLNDFQNDLDRGPFRDADYVYGPAFPRMVYAGASYTF